MGSLEDEAEFFLGLNPNLYGGVLHVALALGPETASAQEPVGSLEATELGLLAGGVPAQRANLTWSSHVMGV